MTGVFAALVGASWSFAVESTGTFQPTLMASVLVVVLRAIHRRQGDVLREPSER